MSSFGGQGGPAREPGPSAPRPSRPIAEYLMGRANRRQALEERERIETEEEIDRAFRQMDEKSSDSEPASEDPAPGIGRATAKNDFPQPSMASSEGQQAGQAGGPGQSNPINPTPIAELMLQRINQREDREEQDRREVEEKIDRAFKELDEESPEPESEREESVPGIGPGETEGHLPQPSMVSSEGQEAEPAGGPDPSAIATSTPYAELVLQRNNRGRAEAERDRLLVEEQIDRAFRQMDEESPEYKSEMGDDGVHDETQKERSNSSSSIARASYVSLSSENQTDDQEEAQPGIRRAPQSEDHTENQQADLSEDESEYYDEDEPVAHAQNVNDPQPADELDDDLREMTEREVRIRAQKGERVETQRRKDALKLAQLTAEKQRIPFEIHQQRAPRIRSGRRGRSETRYPSSGPQPVSYITVDGRFVPIT